MRRPRARRSPTLVAVAAAALLVAAPLTSGAAPPVDRPRVVAYYQTIYETDVDGRHYVDPTPLVGAATDVNVGAIHLNDDGSLHVNDITADHPELVPMWADLAAMQDAGVRVHAFVGGAAEGTYRNLAEDFDRFYPLLRDFLLAYDLDGVDLDIEEPFSLSDTIRLVEALRADLGPDATITLTPVATDLAGETDFSGGFAYADLEAAVGHEIDWYNTQFYCGWGDLASTATFDAILANGFTADRVVAGTVTHPDNCRGWIEPDVLDATLTQIVTAHPTFGGVFGWEYFNALGHDGGGRETWFSHLRDVLADAARPAPVAPGHLAATHARLAAGDEQTVTGTGFVPHEALDAAVTLDVDLGVVAADADGAVDLTFRLPDDAAPGEHAVTVRGAGGTAVAAFTVTAAVVGPDEDPDTDGPVDPGAGGAVGPDADGGAGAAAGPGALARTGVQAGQNLGVAAGMLAVGAALLLGRRAAWSPA